MASDTEQVTIEEDQVIKVIFDRLHSCDGDALAHIAEILTGIACSADGAGYNFFIDDNNREDFQSIFKGV